MTEPLRIRPGQHVMIWGETQTGKSYLASRLTAAVDTGWLVIYDPKRDPRAIPPNCAVVSSAREAIRRLPGRVCWQPSRRELTPVDVRAGWELVCGRAMDLLEGGRSGVLVTHELYDVADEDHFGPNFRAFVTQAAEMGGGWQNGGANGSGIWVSQRPRRIPVMCKSEARHLVAFALNAEEDRAEAWRYMADPAHPEWRPSFVRASLPYDHSFYYRGPDHRLVLHAPLT